MNYQNLLNGYFNVVDVGTFFKKLCQNWKKKHVKTKVAYDLKRGSTRNTWLIYKVERCSQLNKSLAG